MYDLLNEMPYIEFKDQAIDLEAERHLIIPRLIHILLGHKVKDKYNSTFQLKTTKDIINFFKEIKSDPVIVKFLEKEISKNNK